MAVEIDLFYHLKDGRVDGVLVSPAAENDNIAQHFEELNQQLPVVYFDRYPIGTSFENTSCNDFEAGHIAAKHLLEGGSSRIGFVGISESLSVTSLRLKGYKNALKENGIKLQNSLIILSQNESIIYQRTVSLSKKERPPTAFFSSHESYACQVYSACKNFNINIPDEIRLISFAHYPASAFLNPGLSTITQSAYELGRNAALKLIKKLPGNKVKLNVNTKKLPCKFTFRSSSVG